MHDDNIIRRARADRQSGRVSDADRDAGRQHVATGIQETTVCIYVAADLGNTIDSRRGADQDFDIRCTAVVLASQEAQVCIRWYFSIRRRSGAECWQGLIQEETTLFSTAGDRTLCSENAS